MPSTMDCDCQWGLGVMLAAIAAASACALAATIWAGVGGRRMPISEDMPGNSLVSSVGWLWALENAEKLAFAFPVSPSVCRSSSGGIANGGGWLCTPL
eukprot:scaffold4735_cov403-Prasinococcus_capsulatus_cf.AAC.8